MTAKGMLPNPLTQSSSPRSLILSPLAPLPPVSPIRPPAPSFPRFFLPGHVNYLGGWIYASCLHPSCQTEVGPEWMKLKIELSTHM